MKHKQKTNTEPSMQPKQTNMKKKNAQQTATKHANKNKYWKHTKKTKTNNETGTNNEHGTIKTKQNKRKHEQETQTH